MAGFDDAAFAKLEARDDSARGLFDLMREENLKLNDLMRLKRQYEQQGHWRFKADKTSERLKVVEALRVAKEKAAQLVDSDATTAMRRELESKKPLPRSAAVCNWKGYDKDGNLYWCNNAVFVHTRTREPFVVCGYHVTQCVGSHPLGKVDIDPPNALALCHTHFVANTGDAPEDYGTELQTPGIVFARAGMLRHPLAPKPPQAAAAASKSGNGGDDDDEDGDDDDDDAIAAKARADAKMAAAKLKAKRNEPPTAWQARITQLKLALELPYVTRAKRHKAAAFIQSRVRALLARRVTERMRRERLILQRHAAATLMQKALRRIRNVKQARALFVATNTAAARLQRWYRFLVWSRKRVRDNKLRSAATKLVRWFRLRRVRLMLKMLLVRQTARSTSTRRHMGLKAIRTMVRLWKLRRVIAEAVKRMRRMARAARCIQAGWRLYRAHRNMHVAAAARKDAAAHMRSSMRVQRAVRRMIRHREGRRFRRKLLDAAALINRCARGMLGRRQAERQRQRIEAVWRWLAPTLPREMYAEYLGFADYDRMFDLSRFVEKRAPTSDGGGAGSDNVESGSVPAATGRGAEAGSSDEDAADDVGAGEGEAEDDFGADDGAVVEDADEESSGRASGLLLSKRVRDADGRTQEQQLQLLELGRARSAEAAQREQLRKIERRGIQAVPMGRAVGYDAPRLMSTLTATAETGRVPLAPPPPAAVPLAPDQAARIAAYLRRLEAAFQGADPTGVGLLPSAAFQRVLKASGAHFTARLWRVLFDTFGASGSDRVSYAAYLLYARRLDRPCPVHRVLVCPACIFRGHCDKCLCRRYDFEGDKGLISNPHSEVCTCGHHRSRHAPAVLPYAEPPTVVSVAGAALAGARAGVREPDSGRPGYASGAAGALYGSLPDEVARLGVAARAFAPLPSSVSAGLHSRGRLAGLEVGEPEPREEMDDEVGSPQWRSQRDAAGPSRGLAAGSASRAVLGVQQGVPATVALRALPSGVVAEFEPLGAREGARLEALVDGLEQSRVPHGSAAVAHMSLPDLRAANDALRAMTLLSEREVRGGIARMAAGSALAVRTAQQRAQLPAGPAKPRTLLELAEARLDDDRSRASTAAVPAPTRTSRSAGSSSVDGNAGHSTPGLFGEASTWRPLSSRQSAGSDASVGTFSSPQPCADSPPPGSARATFGHDEWQEEHQALDASGRAVLSVPRLTPPRDAGRRGRTPPFRHGRLPDRRSLPRAGAALVPALFVHAVAAGADLASGAHEPTGEDTAATYGRLERRQAALESCGAGTPGTSIGAERRAMFTYLLLLRALAMPARAGAGYDVMADPSALLQLLVAHHAFLQVFWRDLVRDIRVGRLEGGPRGALDEQQRRALGQILAPNPGRAAYLDNVLRAQGMHKYEPSRVAATGNAVSDLFFAKALSVRDLADLRDPGKQLPTRIRRRREEIASASAASAVADAGAGYGAGLVALPLPPADPLRRDAAPPLATGGSAHHWQRAHARAPALLQAATREPPSAARERQLMALTHSADAALSSAHAQHAARELVNLKASSSGRAPGSLGAGRGHGQGLLRDPNFFVLETTPRPFLCRRPGCGSSFGTLAAAVRHLDSHKGVLPLFTSTETDAQLRQVWKSAGLDASGWVPAR